MINGPLQVGCLCRLYLYCLFLLAFVFRFYLALLLLLYHFRVGVADGKVDGGKFLCFCRRGDFAVVGKVLSLHVVAMAREFLEIICAPKS